MTPAIQTEPQAISEILHRYPQGERRWLIPILQDTQEHFGYLPEEAICRVSDHLRVPTSKIYGVATFYNQFRLAAPGKYIVRVCRGTACHVKGSALLLEKRGAGAEDSARSDHARRAVFPSRPWPASAPAASRR